MQGKTDEARIQSEIAFQYARRKHEIMVATYNRGCSRIVAGQVADGVKDLEEAIRLESKHARSYIGMNANLAKLRGESEMVENLLSKIAQS